MDDKQIKALFEHFVQCLNEQNFRDLLRSFNQNLLYIPFPLPLDNTKVMLDREALLNHSISLIADSGKSFKGRVDRVYTRPNGDIIVYWEYRYTTVLGEKKKVEGVECAVINLRDNLISYYAPIRQELQRPLTPRQ